MHPVSEGGSNLAGGQKQRLAVARALYNPKQLMIFDEVTSALDNASEAAVLRFGGIPPYAETRNYVSRILKLIG